MNAWFNPWRDLSGLPRESWILALASVINRAGTMVLPFMTVYLTKDLGLSKAQAGLALSLYGLTALLCAPLHGHLSDRFGPDRVMKASLTSSGLVAWALPLARTWPQMLVGLVLLAVTTEAFRPANLALVGELAGPEQRRQGFALNRLAINLGMSVGPALGGVLATLSFHSFFWVDGATSLAAAAVLVAQLRGRARRALSPHSSHVQHGPLPLLTDRRLLYFMVAMLPSLLVFFQHNSTLAIFVVRDLHLSEAFYGMLFTVNTVLIVLLEVRLNGATAHWPHRWSLALGGLLFGIGFGVLAVANSSWQIIGAVVIWTFGEMTFLPTASAYVSEIAPPHRRGEYMGYYMMGFALSFALGPAAGTAVMQRYGNTALWLVALAVGLISAILLARVPDVSPSGRGSPAPSP